MHINYLCINNVFSENTLAPLLQYFHHGSQPLGGGPLGKNFKHILFLLYIWWFNISENGIKRKMESLSRDSLRQNTKKKFFFCLLYVLFTREL